MTHKQIEEAPYNEIDHTHCWTEENPPCGIKGKHRCCLCEKPVPSEAPDDSREEKCTCLHTFELRGERECKKHPKTLEAKRGIEEWEQEFDRRFTAIDWSEKRQLIDIVGLDLLPHLKDFIHQELQKAREDRSNIQKVRTASRYGFRGQCVVEKITK